MRWQAVVEVPNAFVLRKQTELVNEARREKAVALNPAREVALVHFHVRKRLLGRVTRMRFGVTRMRFGMMTFPNWMSELATTRKMVSGFGESHEPLTLPYELQDSTRAAAGRPV